MADSLKALLFKELLVKRSKRLNSRVFNSGGRNNSGKITAFKKCGTKFRRLLKFVDFWRRVQSEAIIIRFEYNRHRSSCVTLVFYKSGFLSYLILPNCYSIGSCLSFGVVASSKEILQSREQLVEKGFFLGNALPLAYVPEGTLVFNVELWPGKGAQVARSPGVSALVINNILGMVTLKLKSGWKIVVSENCYVTLGSSSRFKVKDYSSRKAGKFVNLGKKQTVRGVAMNAVDHPHGGGRGKSSGGPRPLTPWGKITKQKTTVSAKTRRQKMLIRHR